MDWNKHFSTQSTVSWPINDAPVEAVIKTVTYKLRADHGDDWYGLQFLDVGCGGGATMEWLERRDIDAYGIDVSRTALDEAEIRNSDCHDRLFLGSAINLPFADGMFDGVVEACTIQHLNKEDRQKAFDEINRVLKPGGIFVGYCLTAFDDVFVRNRDKELSDDPCTVILNSGPQGHLQGVGLTHFFNEFELQDYLPNFKIECLECSYELPLEESRRRGHKEKYTNRYYVVYGVKKT